MESTYEEFYNVFKTNGLANTKKKRANEGKKKKSELRKRGKKGLKRKGEGKKTRVKETLGREK